MTSRGWITPNSFLLCSKMIFFQLVSNSPKKKKEKDQRVPDKQRCSFKIPLMCALRLNSKHGLKYWLNPSTRGSFPSVSKLDAWPLLPPPLFDGRFHDRTNKRGSFFWVSRRLGAGALFFIHFRSLFFGPCCEVTVAEGVQDPAAGFLNVHVVAPEIHLILLEVQDLTGYLLTVHLTISEPQNRQIG